MMLMTIHLKNEVALSNWSPLDSISPITITNQLTNHSWDFTKSKLLPAISVSEKV